MQKLPMNTLAYARNRNYHLVISLCKILPGGTAEPDGGGRIADLDFLALESKENLEKKQSLCSKFFS
jgi:hypothetical protein